MRKLQILFYAAIGASVIAGFLIPSSDIHFWWEEHTIFYALLGFIGCVILVVGAMGLGDRFLFQRENYYD